MSNTQLDQSAADLIDSFTDDVLTSDGFYDATTFKVRYPAFSNDDDGTINVFLQEALMHVDKEWINPFRLVAHGLVTAHLLTEAGYGASPGVSVNGVNLSALKGVKSFSIDDMSVTFKDDAAVGDTNSFASTTYGQKYLQIKKQLFGGGIVV